MATAESRRLSRLALAALLAGGGALHFVAPDGYAPLIPPVLGDPRPWILVSGIAEVAAGVLLVIRRRAGGWAAFAVLLAIWPGNVWMALQGGYPGATGFAGDPIAAWIRVALQVPLLAWAYALTRRGPATG